ncbi:hypothetical protein NKOR_04225 [Candidatus Nitrosopumilus koreensis AR1]|uniref:Uncharacterized protein n=1 Tax=Candidatus Nitrosopumilus koreensis AR1 TaxID=1229908 RepID=K0B6X0_9ARCH|nr:MULTISPECIES: hypothetical protein [Nitrosopumilus]AFS80735.1 hypothetical protein NKOR_04225 [Candidatus Nitrosopumilus koreensis AR1]
MANFEKLYKRVASQVIERCHGAIKIKKKGKIIQVYDPKRHMWSIGLAGLVIKEECKLANLRDWEVANVRHYVIEDLLSKPDG